MAEAAKQEPKIEAPAVQPEAAQIVESKKLSRFAKSQQAIDAVISEIYASLFSKDGATRLMAVIFFLSGMALMALVLGSLYFYFLGNPNKFKLAAVSAAEHHDDLFLERTGGEVDGDYDPDAAALGFHLLPSAEIGRFYFELKREQERKLRVDVLSVAEVTVVVECDLHEACRYLENNLTQIRDHLVGYFIGITEPELLSDEGKKRLKQSIMDELNLWVPQGRVKDVFFVKIMVG